MRLVIILALVVRGELTSLTSPLEAAADGITNVATAVCEATIPVSVPGSEPITSFAESNRYSNELVTTPDCCQLPPIDCPQILNYQASDGKCNNVISPQWGIARTYMIRLLFSTKKDYYKFNETSEGCKYISPRVRSTTTLGNEEIPSGHLSLWTMTFGQGIAHDCANSSTKTTVQSCCDGPKAVQNASCAGIDIPKDDYYYSKYNKTCQDVVRHETNLDYKCPIIKPHQLNTATSFIDASHVYGNNDEEARFLRTLQGGELKTSIINGETYAITQSEGCEPSAKICFKCGDDRCNQNTGVTVLQNVLLRLHNLIAKQLAEINPHWDDERLYQEARKILIALIQKIIYYDYLKHILGKEEASKFTSDDPLLKLEWRTYNTFAHAGSFIEWNLCYRQLHTLVRDSFLICDGNGILQTEGGLKIQDYFNLPDPVPEYFDQLICGMAKQPAKQPDLNVVEGIHHNLFKGTKETGDDLISFDNVRDDEWIQDSYVAERKNIWGNKTETFEDLQNYMAPENVEKMRKLYGDVKCINYYTGTFMEDKPEGSVLGKTCTKIVAEQFRRWLVGDRFYFENGRFTDAQLKEIYKVTWSSILCKTSKIGKVSKDSFMIPCENNPDIECSELEFIDLKQWKEPLPEL